VRRMLVVVTKERNDASGRGQGRQARAVAGGEEEESVGWAGWVRWWVGREARAQKEGGGLWGMACGERGSGDTRTSDQRLGR
jgi:hypothetical protein